MKKEIITKVLKCMITAVTALFAAPVVNAEGAGPFIFPGELDFLAIKDVEFITDLAFSDEGPVYWKGEGFHTGIQKVSYTIYNCKDIPKQFTLPQNTTMHFSIVNGYGEETASIDKDITADLNKIKFSKGNFKQQGALSLAEAGGGFYTFKVSISPDLFSYQFDVLLKDEAGARVSNTRTTVDSELAPIVKITSGFPYYPESVSGEKTLQWTIARADDPTNIIEEHNGTFELDASRSLLAADTTIDLPVENLTPGEYVYTLTSDYAPACLTFKAYVDDIFKADISLDKPSYCAGVDNEAKLTIGMSYGYPYILPDPDTNVPTITVATELLEDVTTKDFSDAAWENSDMNYAATIVVPLEKVTQKIVDEYKGDVPMDVAISFNGTTQYKDTVVIPFKYDTSWIESVAIDNKANRQEKYYNIFGVEVDKSYRGFVITSSGQKIIRK